MGMGGSNSIDIIRRRTYIYIYLVGRALANYSTSALAEPRRENITIVVDREFLSEFRRGRVDDDDDGGGGGGSRERESDTRVCTCPNSRDDCRAALGRLAGTTATTTMVVRTQSTIYIIYIYFIRYYIIVGEKNGKIFTHTHTRARSALHEPAHALTHTHATFADDGVSRGRGRRLGGGCGERGGENAGAWTVGV